MQVKKTTLKGLDGRLSKLYEDLGRFTYNQAHSENLANFTGNTEFFLTVNKINAIDKQIGENELEIEKIKDEYG